MFLYSCVQNQHSWQMYSMAMTSVKSWQLSYMALTIHWQYSCTALVSKKSLTTIPYGHQASWQKDAMDVSLKNTIDKVTKFYRKQKKSFTKFWCWKSDAPPVKWVDFSWLCSFQQSTGPSKAIFRIFFQIFEKFRLEDIWSPKILTQNSEKSKQNPIFRK